MKDVRPNSKRSGKKNNLRPCGLRDFEEQVERELSEQDDQASVSSTEVEECLPEQKTLLATYHALAAFPEDRRRA